MQTIERFKTAQETCYEEVLQEMKNGEKMTHWMWFVFPQIFGLGQSATAEYYGIKSLKEAEKMLALEEKQIPADIDYSKVPNLASEARQKLAEISPTTIGQASRISGVNPADISILMVYLRRGYNE